MKQKLELDFDHDGKAIPFPEIKRMISSLEYASKDRIRIKLMILTGMRISESDKITTESFIAKHVVWRLGKKQNRPRKVKLPDRFLVELFHYIKHTHISGKLFPDTCDSFTRRFNKDIRGLLGGQWLKKKWCPTGSNTFGEYEYIYQVKGFRSNYQTHLYAQKKEEYGVECAIHLTCGEMKHSSTKITAYHYIQNFKDLQIEKYKHYSMAQIISDDGQTSMREFY